MSFTGLDVFGKTIQTTNIWLDELQARLNVDKHASWHALGVVLRTLRDRLPLGLAAHLGAQLPIIVRGIYYEQWQPARQPKEWRTAEEFLADVSGRLPLHNACRTQGRRPRGFSGAQSLRRSWADRHVRQALPAEIRNLWPETNEPIPNPQRHP